MELSDLDWCNYLSRCHEAERPQLAALNAYYEGTQPLAYLHPELQAELGSQLQQVVVNWPRLVVDAVEQRLDVEGFRYPAKDTADEDLWAIWQANGMDEQSQQAHVDALVMKRAFIKVGSNEKDSAMPLITAESPLQMHADYDPKTRKVRATLKRWNDIDTLTGDVRDRFATLDLPDATVIYEHKGVEGWTEADRDDHGLGVVPVVPLVNRGRLLTPGGVSELADVLPLSDAACKIATDMMVAAEFHAMPRRWALGFDEQDFTDKDGKPISVWSRIAGRLWASSKTKNRDGAEVGQFPEASLTNFHETINALARLTASIAALPPNYMGLVADDAASADAIRSREARLVKSAERKARAFSGSYEQVARLALRFRDGAWNPDLQRLETLWRDPSTPTFAQKADAVVKLVQADILPREQAWEDLGYSAVKQQRMRAMMTSSMDRVLAGDLAAEFGPKPAPEPVPEPVITGV
ncbi:phage portal protein [Streptomyces sp. NPDC055025]